MSKNSEKRGDKYSRRRLARLNAVQAFYQMELEEKSPREVVSEFLTHRLGAEIDGDQFKDADKTMFEDLVLGAADRKFDIETAIAGALDKDRTLVRLELVLQACLRVATYELMARIDFPSKVIISEYVGIARTFFTGNEPAFVNGVLDRLARELRAAEFE